jgi:hypothetical protein
MKWFLGFCLGMCWLLVGCVGNTPNTVNANQTAPAIPVLPGDSSILVPPTLTPRAVEQTQIVSPGPTQIPTPEQPPIQFTLENRSDWDLCYVYISLPNEDTWGNDWLRVTEWVSSNEDHVFRVPPGIYDIRVENCDFLTMKEQYNVDLTKPTGWIVHNPTILVNDAFQQVGDWKTSGSAALGAISDETYILNDSQSDGLALATDGKSFDNVVMTVEATPLSPDVSVPTGYGMMCRVQPNGDGYLFLIRDDGNYAIFRIDRGQRVPLVDWKASTNIYTGNLMNVIEAHCDGQNLGLRINGVTEEKITDSHYISGDIGLAVLSGETGHAQVRFDNLVVIKP